MPIQYTEAQLADLIKGLEVEFTKELNKAEALNKSEDGEKKDKKPSESKPESEDGAPAAESDESEGESAAPAAEGAPAEGEAAPAPAAAAPAAPGAPGAPAAGHGYDDEDMQHMQQMYASMSREELMAHHDAVRAALDSMSAPAAAPAAAAPGAPAPAAGAPEMGKSERPGHSELKDENPELNSKPTDKGSQTNTEYNKNSGGSIQGNEPRNSPGAKSPASKAEGMQMEKSEKDFDMMKSELEAEKTKSADLKKNLDTVQEFLTKLVTKVSAPKGKAITEVAALAKNEDAGQGADVSSMSKSEITQKLLVKSQDSKTSPQDRAAINAFYLTGANISTISHLLK